MKGLQEQRGASIYTTLIVVALVGVVLLAGLKIVPAYLDNNVIVNAMEGVIANNDIRTMGIGEIRTEVMRTVNVNGIRDFDALNIQLVREGAREYVDINYDARVHLFYNIDALVSFENRFVKQE